jgi:hypothetical protein
MAFPGGLYKRCCCTPISFLSSILPSPLCCLLPPSYRDPREDASRRAAALVAARDLGELKEAVAAQASEHLVDQLR